MNEEAKITLGLETGPIDAGLRKAEHSLEHFGHKMKEQFKEFGSEIAAAFTIGGLVVTLEKALDKAQAITRVAEGLKVSTGFYQDIRNVAGASGIAGDQVERLLDKFTKSLKPGQDIEEQFYKVADAISATQDPIERAHMAMSAFGEKMGPKFLSTLARGRDGIKEMAHEFVKFSDAEIKALEQAKLELERYENFLTVWIGRLAIGLEFAGKNIWGAITGNFGPAKAMLTRGTESGATGGTPFDWDALIKFKKKAEDAKLSSDAVSHAEKIKILEGRKAFEEHEANIARTDADRFKHLAEVVEIEEKITEQKKKQNDEQDKQNKKLEALAKRQEAMQLRIKHEMESVSDARRNLADSRKAPYEFSLEDLASQPMMFGSVSGWRGAYGEREARGILADREAARRAFMYGNFGRGEFLRNRADSNFDALAATNPYLVNPQERMVRALQKQEDHLKELLNRATGGSGGVVVRGGED